MEDFRIETEAGPNESQVVKLSGPFTLATMLDFQTLVRERKAALTLIDLSGVPYMDSAALGCLLGFHVSCAREERKYAIIGASPRLQSLFKVAGVDGVLKVYGSIEAASAAVG
jgi:anti-anti-sigma factor